MIKISSYFFIALFSLVLFLETSFGANKHLDSISEKGGSKGDSVVISGNTTICEGESTTLTATGALNYSWSPATGLNTTTGNTVVASPTITTTYYVTYQAIGPSVIANGDFSAGNTSFSSNYNYTPNNTVEGEYYVGTNPNAWNPGMTGCADHTTGTGNMMMLNGSTLNLTVYCQTVNVQQNTNYAFSTWLQTLTSGNLAQLQFSINGVLLGNVFNANSGVCDWFEFYEIWNSGANNTATICIVNQNSNAGANDFALDDITFSPLTDEDDTVIVTVNQKPTDNLFNTVFCGSGSATLDAGNVGSTYHWSTLETTQTITTNVSGNYSVTVTNAQGCTNVDAADISQLQNISVTLSDLSFCRGETFTIDAAYQGLNYLWNNGAGTQTITSGTPGIYSVTVTGNGCNDADSCVTTLKPSPNDTLSNTIFCPPGSATLDAVNVGSTYHWSTGESTEQITVNTAGTYTVTVTNVQGCTNVDTSIVTQLQNIVVDLPDAQYCQGQSTILDPNMAGMILQWSTGASTATITVNAPGQYSVTVTGNGCNDRDTATVTEVPAPIVNLIDGSICQGDNYTIDAGNAGASYQWSTGDTTQSITVNAVGTYFVTVSTGTSCSTTDSCIVSLKPTPAVNLSDQVICPGSSVILDAGSGADTYNWSTMESTQTIIVNSAGTYYVTVSINGGCTKVDTSLVTQQPTLTVTLNNAQFCEGQTVTLDAGNPGADYMWSVGDTSQTITVGTTGQYSVTVTNNNGCTGRDTSVVTVFPKPLVTLADDAICPGQSTILDAGNAGSTYHWSTSVTTQTITVSSAGTYSVTVTNSNNCTDIDTAIITQSQKPQINLADQQICQGQTASFDAGNVGSTYQWSNGPVTQTMTTGNAGTYYVTVTNSDGCSNSDTATVSIKPKPTVTINDASICPGETVVLDASNVGSSFHWNTNATSQTIVVTTPGTYSVTVTAANACTDADTSIVTQKPKPIDNLSDKAICNNNPVILDAGNAGSTYAWSTGASTQTITVSTTGTFTVTVTNADGCLDTSDAVITIQPPPTVNVPDASVCEGEVATLDAANAGSTYNWNTGATTQAISTGAAGTYTVTVTSTNGCTATDNSVVTVKPKPEVNLPSGSLCETSGLVLDAANSGAAYQWSTGSTSQTITVTTPGAYSVTVTKDNCTNTGQAVLTDCPNSADTPSGFTPNGDGYNDVYYMKGTNIKEFVLMVFNRNGVMVFSTTDITKGWDGRYLGVKQETDVYVYYFFGKYNDGTSFSKKGDITLLN